MKTGNKKGFIRLLLTLTLLLLVGMGFAEKAGWGAENPLVNEYEGIIRLHVIANSDFEQDQDLKMKVKSWLLVKLQNSIAGKESVDEIRAVLQENLPQIEKWASDCVKAMGYDYPVKACLGVRAIPAKQYDDIYFPAGTYEALTVTIGQGQGQNWWCVIFPPLCLVDGSGDEYEELLEEGADGSLVLKSKLKEILTRKSKKR